MFRKLSLYVPKCHGFRKYCAKPTIGFIGLGNMGSILAKKLIESGNKVIGFDKIKTKANRLTNIGLTPAVSAAELATKCNIIFSLLPDYKAIVKVCEGNNGLLSKIKPGTVFVEMSTIGPVNAEYLKVALSQEKIEFISAPISGGVHGGSGDHIFLVGGDKATLKKVEVYLKQMGRNKDKNNVFYMGSEIGDGQTARVCNLLLLACTMVGTAEVMNLGIRLGLDSRNLVKALHNSSAQCWSSSVYNPVPNAVPNSPASNKYLGGQSVNVLMESLLVAQDVATKMKAPIPVGALACQLYNLTISRGYGDKDFSVVYEIMRQSHMPGI